MQLLRDRDKNESYIILLADGENIHELRSASQFAVLLFTAGSLV